MRSDFGFRQYEYLTAGFDLAGFLVGFHDGQIEPVIDPFADPAPRAVTRQTVHLR
jgi:hypothetical protein